MKDQVVRDRDEAAKKAIDALGRYKFWTFAYNAAWWVKLNRLIGDRQPSPFKKIVMLARAMSAE